MIAIPHSEDFVNFKTTPDAPPENIEAEESILGGIILDPAAIYRVKDRLKPEHFYVESHREIYKACLKLNKNNQPIDLITVTSYLSDNKKLSKIGGRNKLASIVDRTVSAVNIDALSDLVISKAVRRDLIKVGNQFIHLGYAGEYDLSEIFSLVQKRTQDLISASTARTKEEQLDYINDRLVAELKRIYSTIPEPNKRLLALKWLANEFDTSIGFLEHFYLKSLASQCSKLMTYKDLKEAAQSTVRRWLLNGLIPNASTILLAADGGIGKTKMVYNLAKKIIDGTQFGDFIATGQKRRILYYQGDESVGDMYQALETLGYSESDIQEHVRVRFGWSFENMPVLIQDLHEFQPHFIVVDSLSFANRYSMFREGEAEYARPLLECAGLATEYNSTFLFIHHTNRDGGVRGTTAIRNSVSEVWKLSKDTSHTSTPYDRILEIDKSRSRSSGKKYRLYFEPETLEFTFLGEEGEELGGPNRTAKEKILQYLADNRNQNFTARVMAQLLYLNETTTGRALRDLSSDGLVSCNRKPGKAYTYFLEWTGDRHARNDEHSYERDDERYEHNYEPQNPGIATVTPISSQNSSSGVAPLTTSDYELRNTDTARVSAEARNAPSNFDAQKNEQEKKHHQKTHLDYELQPKSLPVNDSDARNGCDPSYELCPEPLPVNNSDARNHARNSSSLPTIKSLHQSPVGEVKAIAIPGGQDGGYEIRLEIPNLETVVASTSHTEQRKVQIVVKKMLMRHLKSLRYEIHVITSPPGNYEWVNATLSEHHPNEYNPKRDKWVFLYNGHEYPIFDLSLIRLQ
ncbi:DnaB-like helicase N-terminal domain-containing protein [Calothrix sp. 336/3]|uniref:DnaB-like helicase N-terminal domain-containing protein n=1 Tax=Calothrix sp. 336/3 TaxID=1337936 RepID=UPI0006996EE0|nr:DnaB-like helicase N-terminal domain-containing protein [Calothrix sp. 336/3]